MPAMAEHTHVRGVAVIGAGLDLGAGRRGVDMGPSAARIAGLAERLTALGCKVVAFRVDNLNLPSQRAVEALGARLDGVLRHYQPRRDGSARDMHVYSILASEWPDVRTRLLARLARHAR